MEELDYDILRALIAISAEGHDAFGHRLRHHLVHHSAYNAPSEETMWAHIGLLEATGFIETIPHDRNFADGAYERRHIKIMQQGRFAVARRAEVQARRQQMAVERTASTPIPVPNAAPDSTREW